jgi:hypothetical protein
VSGLNGFYVGGSFGGFGWQQGSLLFRYNEKLGDIVDS